MTQLAEPTWPPADGGIPPEIVNQGPVHSYTHAFPLENMLHASSLAGRSDPDPGPESGIGPVVVGDRGPDFVITGLDGSTRTLADFTGRPLVLRLSRAVSELLVCPLCMPGLQELNGLYEDFVTSGFQLAVVFSTNPEITERIAATKGLTYPLYSNPSWDLYRAYGTGHVLLAPRQAWAVVDGQGIVRWTWHLGEDGAPGRVPLPSEVLAVAHDLFGT